MGQRRIGAAIEGVVLAGLGCEVARDEFGRVEALGLAPEFQGLPGVVSTCCGTGVGSRDIETFYGGGFGGPTVLLERESPNAAAIFVNWLLTREGARAYLEGTGQIDAHCSARSDLRGICKREPPLQDNGSYFAMDHESTNFIENATAEIAEEALGGR